MGALTGRQTEAALWTSVGEMPHSVAKHCLWLAEEEQEEAGRPVLPPSEWEGLRKTMHRQIDGAATSSQQYFLLVESPALPLFVWILQMSGEK